MNISKDIYLSFLTFSDDQKKNATSIIIYVVPI